MFLVNAIEVVGVQCEWSNITIQQRIDNTQVFSSFATHTWNVDVMLASLYTSLRVSRGQQVTLTTNDFTALNTIDKVYTDVILETIVGNQEGHLMRNVNVIFRVDIT